MRCLCFPRVTGSFAKSLFCLAAACMSALTACTSRPTVIVAPDPMTFGQGGSEAVAGEKIVREHCAACHSLTSAQARPNRKAPAMDTLLFVYPPDALADRLVAGAELGHRGMPVFDLNVVAADAVIAYLEAITPPHMLDQTPANKVR
jgi:hypothetical protein